MTKTVLIVYHSRTGGTRQMATAAADAARRPTKKETPSTTTACLPKTAQHNTTKFEPSLNTELARPSPRACSTHTDTRRFARAHKAKSPTNPRPKTIFLFCFLL